MAMTHKERKARRKAIAKHLREGNTVPDTARKFDVTPSTVRDVALQHRVRTRAIVSKMSRSTYGVIAKIINTELSYHTIGEVVGMSFQAVQQIAEHLRAVGVKFPTRLQHVNSSSKKILGNGKRSKS